jgi:nucleotidyltransferase/DNA polymerase involved in DNA repair
MLKHLQTCLIDSFWVLNNNAKHIPCTCTPGRATYCNQSAGISHNKLLAKLASGMNKPNNQTVIPVSAVANLMNGLPLNKIRNFGGKLGDMLQALGCVTAADVQKLSLAQLEKAVGDSALYVL